MWKCAYLENIRLQCVMFTVNSFVLLSSQPHYLTWFTDTFQTLIFNISLPYLRKTIFRIPSITSPVWYCSWIKSGCKCSKADKTHPCLTFNFNTLHSKQLVLVSHGRFLLPSRFPYYLEIFLILVYWLYANLFQSQTFIKFIFKAFSLCNKCGWIMFVLHEHMFPCI